MFTKLPWLGDSEDNDLAAFKSSCHLPICLPHTVEASHWPFYCSISNRVAVNTNLVLPDGESNPDLLFQKQTLYQLDHWSVFKQFLLSGNRCLTIGSRNLATDWIAPLCVSVFELKNPNATTTAGNRNCDLPLSTSLKINLLFLCRAIKDVMSYDCLRKFAWINYMNNFLLL